MALGYESALGSHVGMVRANNQDSGFAGNRLFLVADGMGGHAGGDVASAITARAMARTDPGAEAARLARESGETVPQDPRSAPPHDPLEAARALRTALLKANSQLRSTVEDRPELSGMGTTFTGFVTVGDQLALAHIGDSRLYLLRGGKLTQITKDHTFVQRLVDSGRITEEEAKTHPRRSVLMRVLGDVDSSPEVDTEVLDTQVGDVWLLCSDGLCGYVEDHDIEKIMLRRTSLQACIDGLIDKALSHGAPDNVTAVLVETVAEPLALADLPGPRFAGSAVTEIDDDEASVTDRHRTPRRRSIRRPQPVEESHFEPRVDEYLSELIAETKRRNRRRRFFWAFGLIAIIAIIVGALTLGYQWTQTRYFVGTDGQTVIIYRGIPQSIGSFSFSSVAEDTGIPLSSLDGLERRQVERTLGAESVSEAREIVLRLGAP